MLTSAAARARVARESRDVTEARVWRRCVAAMLVTLAATLGAVATLNLLVNPLNLYSARLLPPRGANIRAQKVELLQRSPPRLRALILGSSRSMKLAPTLVESLTGLQAFNGAVSAAVAEDHYALLRYAVGRLERPITLVVLGLDVEAFQEDDYDITQVSPELFEYLGRDRLWEARKRMASLVGMHQTRLSIKTLWLALHGRLLEPPWYFEPDGRISPAVWEVQRATPGWDLRDQLRKTASWYIGRYSRFPRLSPGRRDVFEATLRYAREQGITVIVFVTTLHPDVASAIRSIGYDARREELLRELRRLGNAWGAPVHDFTSIESFGGDPAGFYDGHHMDARNSELLLRRLLAPHAHAVQ